MVINRAVCQRRRKEGQSREEKRAEETKDPNFLITWDTLICITTNVTYHFHIPVAKATTPDQISANRNFVQSYLPHLVRYLSETLHTYI